MSMERNVGSSVGAPMRNVQHERFALAVATGQKLADAYREAFPRSARWKEASTYTAASRLAARPDVARRIADLRTAAASDDCMKRHELLLAISDALREAARDHALAASASLVDKYCKMCGFYAPEKVEARVGLLTDEQVSAKVGRLLRGGRRG